MVILPSASRSMLALRTDAARMHIKRREGKLGQVVHRYGRSQAMTQTYSGGCQCGKVRYEVQMDIGEVLACNCSRCGRLGSLLAFAPAVQFKLLSGDADLTKFEFNKHMIQHQFCSTCGIQSFAMGTHPKTGAKLAAINVRCVDGVDVDTLQVKKVDGRRL
jgi:hypothetical protein